MSTRAAYRQIRHDVCTFSPLPDVLEMFEFLPDAQLAVLPGATHVGLTRRPGQLLALIMSFLDAR